MRRFLSQAEEAPSRTVGAEDLPWCLVTGLRAVPARLHGGIKSVRGAQTSGASLVSFNLDAFTSHGWEQGENAPVSEPAAAAYVAALNHLLDFNNTGHRHVEGNITFVFWAGCMTPMEEVFSRLLGIPFSTTRERDCAELEAVTHCPSKALPALAGDEAPFFVLGIAPNAARLAVRLWCSDTVGRIAGRFLAHFDELEVVGLGTLGDVPTLWRLVGAAARNEDPKTLNDQLHGVLAIEITRAILTGGPYPHTLLVRVIERCRAERSVTPIRAGVIKAVLNRRIRQSSGKETEITVSLDPNNTNPGYLLGRLFAVLERTQRAALRARNPSAAIKITIRDHYFGAAMAAPNSVFTALMSQRHNHIGKLRQVKPGLAHHYERLADSIISNFPGNECLPDFLSLEDQGYFILGYHHHQRYHSSDTRAESSAGNEAADLNKSSASECASSGRPYL